VAISLLQARTGEIATALSGLAMTAKAKGILRTQQPSSAPQLSLRGAKATWQSPRPKHQQGDRHAHSVRSR
jgi:hypothetical protein